MGDAASVSDPGHHVKLVDALKSLLSSAQKTRIPQRGE
jgi:hypothetical protein